MKVVLGVHTEIQVLKVNNDTACFTTEVGGLRACVGGTVVSIVAFWKQVAFSDHRVSVVEWRLLKNWEAMSKKRKGNEQVEKQVNVKEGKKKKGHIRAWVLKVFTDLLESLRPFSVDL